MTQGKCVGCRIIYRWAGTPLLRDAYCIHCRKALKRHARLLNGKPVDAGFDITCAKPYSPFEDIAPFTIGDMQRLNSIMNLEPIMLPLSGCLRIFGVPQETFYG